MTAPVLADALGPRARRQVMIASVAAAAVLVAVVIVGTMRLQDRGQLDWALWEPFTQRAVLRFLLVGLWATVRAAAVAMVLALAIGAVLALGRLAQNGPVRWAAGAYVEVFRALPLLLMILFCAQGLPRLDVDLSIFWYVVIGLVAYNSAVLGEIFRAGILSLDRGQTDAALSMGMTYWQAMRTVVVPQAVRRMVPAIVSQLVTLLKDTSLGAIVAYEELLRRARIVGAQESGRYFLQALVVAALMYIVVNLVLSRLAARLEIRQRRRYRASALGVSGIEDLAVVDVRAEEALSER